MPDAPTYDCFVSYSDADRAWVEGYLLVALEQAGVRYQSEAGFTLGVPRLLQLEQVIKASLRVVLVLSPAYLADSFARFADLLAQSYGVEEKQWPVIPLVLQPIITLPPRLSMLTHLDATDPERWDDIVARLCAALQRPVPAPSPRPPCPYPGMAPFTEADSGRFFGREREVAELRRRLRYQNYFFVIGPSGSGKSSLIFAGLIPELLRRQPGMWVTKIIRPGHTPLATLLEEFGGGRENPIQYEALVASTLAQTPGATRLLLVIDQFEELFTQVPKRDQAAFITAIQRLRGVTNCAIVLTMRADFYEDLMESDLWPVAPNQRLELAPLRGSALREAIARPAETCGVYLEAGLLERLLADAAEEPGVLPLMQETMVLLWEELERHLIPFRAYERLGSEGRSGLAVAIAAKADGVLVALTPVQQVIARRLLLRLIQFGEGRADTRQQKAVSALRSSSEDSSLFTLTLDYLANNRLLTLSGTEASDERMVDIAHEALISGWPALQLWLVERRDAEQARRRLEDKALEWARFGREGAGLLDEVELLEAERWISSFDAEELGYSSTLVELILRSREMIETTKLIMKRLYEWNVVQVHTRDLLQSVNVFVELIGPLEQNITNGDILDIQNYWFAHCHHKIKRYLLTFDRLENIEEKNFDKIISFLSGLDIDKLIYELKSEDKMRIRDFRMLTYKLSELLNEAMNISEVVNSEIVERISGILVRKILS